MERDVGLLMELEICEEGCRPVERAGGLRGRDRSVEMFGDLWKRLEVCEGGGLGRTWRSIQEKRSEIQITPRLSAKASPEIIHNICKYIYGCICHKAYITWADNDPHLNHSLTNATGT